MTAAATHRPPCLHFISLVSQMSLFISEMTHIWYFKGYDLHYCIIQYHIEILLKVKVDPLLLFPAIFLCTFMCMYSSAILKLFPWKLYWKKIYDMPVQFSWSHLLSTIWCIISMYFIIIQTCPTVCLFIMFIWIHNCYMSRPLRLYLEKDSNLFFSILFYTLYWSHAIKTDFIN